MAARYSPSVLTDWTKERLAYISTLKALLPEQTSKLYRFYTEQETVFTSLLASAQTGNLRKTEAMRLLGSFIGKGQGEDHAAAQARSAISRGLIVSKPLDACSTGHVRLRIAAMAAAEPNQAAALHGLFKIAEAAGLKTVSFKALLDAARQRS